MQKINNLKNALRLEINKHKESILYVSRPRAFTVSWEINPWMEDNIGKVDTKLAKLQWLSFINKLRSLRIQVRILDCPDEGLADVTFVANAGSFLPTHGKGYKFVPARFRYDPRKPETNFFIDQMKWEESFVDIQMIKDGTPFEGDGDLLRLFDCLVLGYGFRTSEEATDIITKYYKGEEDHILKMKLVDPRFYHLDTCFFYHGINCVDWTKTCGGELDHICIYYPKAFSPNSLAALRRKIEELQITAFEVNEEEALQMCCNAVGYDRYIVASNFPPRLKTFLEYYYWKPIETPLTEFHKSGGSAKCLTFRRPIL
jgi:N-dimethylarginine dimethylaminohydrolase